VRISTARSTASARSAGSRCQVSLKVKDGQNQNTSMASNARERGAACGVKGAWLRLYPHPPPADQTAVRRKDCAPPKGLNVDPGKLANPLRRSDLGRKRWILPAGGMKKIGGARAWRALGRRMHERGSPYLFQKIIRQGIWSYNVDPPARGFAMHLSVAATDGERRFGGRLRDLQPDRKQRRASDCDRCESDPRNHPVAATFFKQFAARRQADS